MHILRVSCRYCGPHEHHAQARAARAFEHVRARARARMRGTRAHARAARGQMTASANAQLNWPQSATTTGLAVLPDWEPTASISFTTSMPSTTEPKTTCLPSSHAVFTVHKKNCEPFVFGPAFAMERMPGPVCFSVKFSSANFAP